MGYDNRSVTDYQLHFDMSREAEFCAAVAASANLDPTPDDFYDAFYSFNFMADIEDDGSATAFDIEWMSGDPWDDDIFSLMAPYMRRGDYVEMRHVDGDDGSVNDARYLFDGLGGWEYRKGRVVFECPRH